MGRARPARARTRRPRPRHPLDVLEKTAGVTAVPGFGAWAYSSDGTLSSEGFRTLAEGFLGAVGVNRDVDGIYLCLHGSMVAADEMDPEGRLLEETRRIVGEDVPIVVSLDLHGVLTERLLRQADAVVCYLTYPHVDFRATGGRAARLLLRILDGGVRPVTARVTIPALVRGDELITDTGAFGRFTRRAAELEAGPGGLSAGMLISNPFTDVPELQTSAFVVTDGDPGRAAAEALAQATGFWDVRERMRQPLVPSAEAVEIARATTSGTVILTDAADARAPARRATATRSCGRSRTAVTRARSSRRSSTRRPWRPRSAPVSAAPSARRSAAGSTPRASRRCRSRAAST